MITVILTFLAGLGVSFLCTAGLVWLLCWALNLLGIFTICGVAIVFSWPLALAVWVIVTLIKSTFNVSTKSNK